MCLSLARPEVYSLLSECRWGGGGGGGGGGYPGYGPEVLSECAWVCH